MDTVVIQTVVTADRRLIVDLPAEVPLGMATVTVTIQPTVEPTDVLEARKPLTRDEARRRLLAAGILNTAKYAPEGAIALSEEERLRIGRLLSDDTKTMLDLVNEDRRSRE